jgi:hypothetical protein
MSDTPQFSSNSMSSCHCVPMEDRPCDSCKLEELDELLQRMIVSAEVYTDHEDTVTGYKIKTGALHRIIALRNLFVPQHLPPASAHEPCRGCGGVGSHNGGAISQTCKRCGGSGRTEPQHVALDMHVNSMCGWAEILAAKVGWTRQNANSFWTSYDAARTAASRPPPPAALAALAPFQHMRVDTNPEPIDALDIRALDDDGREITIGYARNHEWADKLNQAFERVRSALTKGSAP